MTRSVATPLRRLLAAAAPLLAAACGETRGHSGDILGGEVDTGDPAVVALVKGGHAYCTGTLIAPDVVLTAAHCVVEPGSIQLPDSVHIGTFVGDGGPSLPVAWVEIHPSYNERTMYGDLALVGLAEPAAGVQPLALARNGEGFATLEFRFVGFGFTEEGAAGSFGTKYMGRRQLRGLSEELLVYGHVTCYGDSGGPALLDSQGTSLVAGVTSHGPGGCFDIGNSYSTRVDVLAAWIDQRLARAGAGCEADSRCRADCAGPDPDCSCVADGSCDQCQSGVVDVDCATTPVGEACSTLPCESGAICHDGVCTRICADDGSGECSLGQLCLAAAGAPRSVCVEPPPEPQPSCAAVSPAAATASHGRVLLLCLMLITCAWWLARGRRP